MPLDEGGPYERRAKREALPFKRRYSTVIGSSNVKIVEYRHRHAAYYKL